MTEQTYALSASYTNADFPTPNLDQRIDIFEDQIRNWYLVHARTLENDKHMGRHSGFAVLAILMGYFEAVARLISGSTGTSKRKSYFWQGFLEVFPQMSRHPDAKQNEVIRDVLWEELRSGLYHRLQRGPAS